MKRLLGLSVVGLLLTGLTINAQEKTTPLYPLKVGNTWTYKVPGGSIQVKVEKKEDFGGEKDAYKLETSAQGKVAATEHVVVKEDGVYRVGVNGLKPDAPIKFLHLPPEKGKKWNVNTKVQGQDVTGDFVIKEEDVTVPAGQYKGATLVEGANFKIAGMDTSIKCWFAKDVGIVKLEFKLGGQDATLELEKFEAGK
jgi:hypothetical protein